MCTCPAGWRGSTCQNAYPCDTVPCANGATCTNELGSSLGFRCQCSGLWTGDVCTEHPCDQGSGKGCLNGGTCNSRATRLSQLCTCSNGFEGTNCQIDTNQPYLEPQESESDSGAAIEIIIPVIAVVLVLSIVLLTMYLRRQRGNVGDARGLLPRNRVDWGDIDESDAHVSSQGAPPGYHLPSHGHVAYQYGGAAPQRLESAAAQLAYLDDRLQGKGTSGEQNWKQEFTSMAKAKPSASFRQAETNSNRNRYRDILAYDDTRVRLMDDDNDYINANHITMTVAGRQAWYIGSQGPTPLTTEHFWQMIWEQHSRLVVMVTGEVEKGVVKCETYWPERAGSSITHGDLTLSLDQQRANSVYTIRSIRVRHNPSGEERTVWHLQYTTWPDHGVPETTSGMLAFVDEMRSIKTRLMANSGDFPTVVHCSAGIGRTGVTMMVELGLAKIEAGQLPDMRSVLQELREQRYGLVQTASQYEFVYRALRDAMNVSSASKA